jgi:serine phosphatase RsbU (regulator of sigma subunit)
VSLPPGIAHTANWPASQVQLGERWTVLMYTDGLIEGRIGKGPERLGGDGLIKLIEKARAQAPDGVQAGAPASRQETELIIDSVIAQARELNGGDLDDDIAVLAVTCMPAPEPAD